MVPLDKGYCLVLSGGGARGVYHIGVWRALRELGIEAEAFVGASIGALIAALLAQGSDGALEEIGRSITLGNVISLPPELSDGGELKLDRESLSAARRLFEAVVRNKGLDTSPLRELLARHLDEGKVRSSGKDLGIVTVNVSALEPRELYLEDMEEGLLVDYLMASAAFPGFEAPVIAGKKYADGGLYDNIPYAMARRRGYRRLIVSDISGAGRNRKPDVAGTVTVYIKNSMDLGGVFDFERGFLDRFTLLGYLDALRAFGRLVGYDYFLEPDEEAERAFGAGPASKEEPEAGFPERMRRDRRELLKRLECAAAILQVERVARYGYGSLEAAIRAKCASEEERVAAFAGRGAEGKAGIARIRDAVARGSLEGSPYYYWRLVEERLPRAAGSVTRKALVGLYPELPAGLRYLGRS